MAHSGPHLSEVTVDALLLAQDTTTDGGSAVVTLLLYAAILGGIFWFLIIRPNRTRAKRHQELMATLGVGDEVQTAGGIYGVVRDIDEDTVIIEVEDGSRLRVARRAVAGKTTTEVE